MYVIYNKYMSIPFKNTNFEERKEQALGLIKKYPERCPIIVTSNNNTININQHKFLVPKDLTLSQFTHIIKNRNNITPITALFAFINKAAPIPTQRIGVLHKKYKNDDYFLYIDITSENTFGYNALY
jgi:hypothetical protein